MSPSFDTIVNKEKLPPEITIVPRPPILSKKKRRTGGGAGEVLIQSRNANVSKVEIPPILPRPSSVPAPKTTSASAFNADDLQTKRELLFKLDMIKRQNPALDVPEYGMSTNIDMMKTTYNMFIRRLTVDNTVDTYKHYLTYAFLCIEIAVTKLTSINMKGFSRHHQSMMSQYEKLLIELGEQADPEGKSRLSPGWRLGLIVGVNSVIFVMARAAFTPDIAAQFLTNLTPAPTRRMKPPETVVA